LSQKKNVHSLEIKLGTKVNYLVINKLINRILKMKMKTNKVQELSLRTKIKKMMTMMTVISEYNEI
jgi:hypothetical protein